MVEGHTLIPCDLFQKDMMEMVQLHMIKGKLVHSHLVGLVHMMMAQITGHCTLIG